MIAFLLSFPGGGTRTGSDGDHGTTDPVAALGQQVTLLHGGAIAPVQSMLALADPPGNGVDLVAHGEGHGWFYDRNSGRFQSERNTQDISVNALLARIAPTNEFTFTLVGENTGPRLAVDRDGDGLFNLTELDHGFDPLDPLSRSGNSPPRLNPVPPFFATLPALRTHPGLRVSTTNITATDVDLPAQTLTFSLTDDAPPGATIHPATGFFSWTPPLNEPGGERRIAVRVTDDGAPPLDRVGRVSVTIVPLRARHIERQPTSGDVFIVWDAVFDVRYRVQCKDQLDELVWRNLTVGISFLLPDAAATVDSTTKNVAQRFYRIGLLE
jgi:hypothetical protein